MENGYTSQYSLLNAGIEEELSDEIQEEVSEILEMYAALQFSFSKLENRAGIDAEKIKFMGFDGNNEVEHLAFGKFLNETGRFEETLVVNSHRPTIDIYRRQLAAWKDCADRNELSKEDIEKIVAARARPDAR